MAYPRMMRLRQRFEAPTLADPAQAVRDQMAGLNLKDKVKPGQTVALTVGSRGIANMALIAKTVVEELKKLGAEPFIVPAMGSHGGGKAEGQRAIVEGYGVTEDYVGAPIKSSMDVVEVGATPDGIPVFFDKHAYEADHVVVIGRIKPHTDFQGSIQSGLHKMMLIGLGKHKGALNYHKAFIHYSFDKIMREVGAEVIKKCGVLFGLGLVENPADQTALIEAVPPDKFQERESELLKKAIEWLPRLPFKRADLVIIDYIGKNISGSGMDTNVVGRKTSFHRPDNANELCQVTRIYIRDLTPETEGNATGLGIADYAHQQLIDKVDFEKTYINCVTGQETKAASTPMHWGSDKEVLENAFKNVGYLEPEQVRVIRIKSTLDLTEVLVSEPYLEDMKGRDDLTQVGEPFELEFDEKGDMLDW